MIEALARGYHQGLACRTHEHRASSHRLSWERPREASTRTLERIAQVSGKKGSGSASSPCPPVDYRLASAALKLVVKLEVAGFNKIAYRRIPREREGKAGVDDLLGADVRPSVQVNGIV
jgi:hypothetical protein